MTGTYNIGLVCLSIVVAIFVSYTALSLAARVRAIHPGKGNAKLWLAGGALAMGGGIWSMHFIGMLAFSLPIPLAYSVPKTVGSLAIGIAIAGFALVIAARPRISLAQLVLSAVIMGLGISAMHYSGMSAIEILPGITYEPKLLLASIVIAIVASFAALGIFRYLGRGRSWRIHAMRAGAAIVMGFAICGMHYTGMAASQFAPGSYCLTSAGADNHWLAITIALLTLGVLTITIILLVYDAHLQRSRTHSRQLQQANARLQHVATHDALTGLPNRVLLADRLEQAIAQAERDSSSFALMMVDLDRFKSINDSLGHQAGDALLVEVAQRLRSSLRKVDTLARIGGDEFVIILSGVRSSHDTETVLRNILEQVSLPVKLTALDVQTSPSIGVSIYPHDGTDAQTLLKHADAAMYHAKKIGRNTFQFFAPAMNAFTRERLELEGGLHSALRNGEFELYYQPKVDVRSGHIGSAEALIRWNHPERGLMLPGSFIPLAEETGIILQIGEWVLFEACRQVATWHAAGFADLRVAVNLSAQQFRQENLDHIVRTALAQAQLDARFLEIELTETAVMQDPEKSATMLHKLSELGVHISVDDFGAGYSSLGYLRRFPLDKLKIDRAFISEIARCDDDAQIVRAIVTLAHSLRLAVIAEGVETADQLEFLREVGCDQYQGYYCSMPVKAESFEIIVKRERLLAKRRRTGSAAAAANVDLHCIANRSS
jgi:diguanylate cyclase